MGQEWDNLSTPSRTWEVGGGFTKPGIGERQTAWPSYSATTRYGSTNPTCAVCGGRLRGAKKCGCPKPHDHWKPVGKRRKLPQDTPDSITSSTGITEHLKAITEWHKVWLGEAYRVLEPGGVLGAFSGTRVMHHLARGMAEVGFADIRLDAWAYGSGFPKSLNVGKQIDRRGGDAAERTAFYEHLKERREAAGMSRTGVTERVTGIRTGSCWNWEHYSLPEPKYWPALKALLDLDSKWDDLILGAERDVLVERTMVQGGGNALEMRMGDRREVNADITAPATPEAHSWHGWGTALKPAWEPVIIGRKPCG